ncbi:MAG: hypothetical protein IKA00_10955 [Prevotella sp.]|nr:hypothetical protein [Prevotella sp.]
MKKLFFIIAAAIMMVGCKSVEYVPVLEHRTDTVYQSKVVHDSIYQHDSTYIKEKGDSVYIERWHTKYVLKEKTDTLYESRVDSIPIPYEVVKEVEVEKSLSWWQSMRMHIGGIVCWLLLILAIYGILKWRKWL